MTIAMLQNMADSTTVTKIRNSERHIVDKELALIIYGHVTGDLFAKHQDITKTNAHIGGPLCLKLSNREFAKPEDQTKLQQKLYFASQKKKTISTNILTTHMIMKKTLSKHFLMSNMKIMKRMNIFKIPLKIYSTMKKKIRISNSWCALLMRSNTNM